MLALAQQRRKKIYTYMYVCVCVCVCVYICIYIYIYDVNRFSGAGDTHVQTQAKGMLALAQQRRKKSMQDDRESGEFPISLKVGL